MEALIESASLRRRLHFAMFATGLLGIGYEVVGIRVLSQVLENTVYTFATVLSVYLLGTSVGAALNQRFAKRPSGTVLLTRLLCALATSCALGIVALSRMPTLYRAARASLGDSPPAVLVAELLAAIAVFGLPTIFMGALFAELAQRLRCDEGGVGAAAALNTFGGALAAVLFAIVILPVIGAKWTLVSIAAGYTVVSVALFQWPSGLLAAVVVLVMTFPVNLQLVQLPPGHKLTQYREGVMDSVAVIENLEGQRTLRVNSRFQMGSTAAAAAEYRQAHIPLLLHANPKRALFLGVGTGITIGAATVHPNLRSDGVELVPEIVELMPAFEPHNFSPTHQPNLTIHIADARRFVRASDSTYDVIVADLFHPARDGAGSLYTVEHFRAIRERLAPGGLFCQWLPLYQLDEEMLRVIARTFLEIFPDAEGWLLQFNVDTPVLGLVGKTEPGAYDEQWIERRLAAPALETGLKKLALADSIRFFGCLVADAQMLWTFAADAPSNTDDLPRVTFDAPRFTYRKDALPYGRLLALLKLGNPDAHHTLMRRDNLQTAAFHERLARYWRARDVYLQALIADAGGKHSQAIDNFVESARLSDDFTPGYAQCLTIASLEAKSNPAKAEALLQRLIAAQPSRPVAREMLNRLAKPENKGAARQEP
jgi:spermidine synthase